MSEIRRFVPLVAVVLAALLVGNLVYNVEHLRWGPEEEPPMGYSASSGGGDVSNTSSMASSLRYVAAAAMMLLLSAGIVIGVSKAFTDRKNFLRNLAAYAIVAGVLALLLVVIISYASGGGQTGPVPLPFSGGGASTGSGSGSAQGKPTPLGTVIIVVASVAFITMIVGAFAMLRRTRRTASVVDELQMKRREAASALDKALYDISAGGDYKRAVLQCYKDMVRLCATKGVADEDYLTAREFEALATRALALGGELHDLTLLFEEARYSPHELAEAQKQKALRDLEAVKRSLLTDEPGNAVRTAPSLEVAHDQ